MVVTISRQLASGGAYIGQRLAQRLGYRYVDREILTRAALSLGVDDDRSLEHLEEQVPGWWDRIARVIGVGPPEAPYVPPPPPVDEGRVLEAETGIIRVIAEHEDAVIVGRGAPHVLRGRDNVFRVFIHAPKEYRTAEVQRTYQLDAAAAQAMVERSDRTRARFIQSLVGRAWTDACLYDLTVDTSRIGPDLVVELLASAVSGRR